jgi:alkylhydroperoxidase family enzyme
VRLWASELGDTPVATRRARSCPIRPCRPRRRSSCERAALELTEQGTRIADAAGGVTDEAWADAAKHYDDDQLAALVALIALINTYNRVNVITRQPAGDYQPGQWG